MSETIRSKLAIAAVLILTLGAAASADARVSHIVVAINRGGVQPSALTMQQDDVLEFVNYTAAPVALTFIQPHDSESCHVVALGAGQELAPDAFIWAAGHDPAAIIPPGGFVDICSLAPGRYVFVTTEIGTKAAGPMETLGMKGTVTVE